MDSPWSAAALGRGRGAALIAGVGVVALVVAAAVEAASGCQKENVRAKPMITVSAAILRETAS